MTRNLSRSEFSCKCGCGLDTVDWDLPKVIQEAVDYFQNRYPEQDIRVKINSGNRCTEYNKAVSGSSKSQHVRCKAADIVIYDKISGKDIHADAVADYFEETFPYSHGIGRYIGRTHIDVRGSKARWDKRS